MFTKIPIPQEYKTAMIMAEKDLNTAKMSVSNCEMKMNQIVLEIHCELEKSKKNWTLFMEKDDLFLINIEEYQKHLEEEKNKESNKEDQKKEESPVEKME
jgi:hypothetical protein